MHERLYLVSWNLGAMYGIEGLYYTKSISSFIRRSRLMFALLAEFMAIATFFLSQRNTALALTFLIV